MPIPTRCPNCDAAYNLAESQRGKKVQCRKCSTTFVVGEETKKAPAAASAAKSGKIRKDALQTDSAPPSPRMPPPKAKPSAVRRDRDRDDEDEAEEENERRPPPRKKKGGLSTPLLLMIGGGVLLLMLLGGGTVFALWWFSKPAAPPPVTNVASQGDIPTDPNDAVLWIQSSDTPDRKNKALEWLATAPVVKEQRQAVAKVLEQQLSSPFTRDSALKALAQWAGPENVPALLRQADMDDQWIFGKKGGPAVEALIGMKDKDPNAQAGLIKILGKRLGTDAHADAAEALGRIGPAAENEVLTHLDDPKGSPFGTPGSEEARKLLATWNTSDDRKLDQALQDLKSIDSNCLRLAADYLSKANVIEARRADVSKALVNALNDKEGKTRAAAAIALKTWGTRDNVPDLINEMDREGGFGESREPCMMALAAIKDPSGAEAIARHLKDFGNNKEAAFNALRTMGPVAENAVKPYLTDKDPKVREQASLLLQSFNTGGAAKLDAVLTGLSAQEPEQRKQACETLAAQKVDPDKQKEVSAALVRLLGDQDPFGRVPDAAAKALAVWGDKDSVPALLVAMENPRSRCWQSAMDALVKIKDDRAVYALLLMVTEKGQPHAQEALKALNDLGPFVETALDNRLGDPKVTAQEKVVLCQYLKLPGVGTSASLPTLQQAATSPSASLKAAANDAIKEIGKREPRP